MRSRAESTELSIIIPIFNEELVLKKLFIALNKAKNYLPKNVEVIFIDDGSTDSSVQLIQKLSLVFRKKVIQLSRNFGHQAALLAGMEVAIGKYIVTMDGDLQHPLSMIPQMIHQHQKGIDIVLTKRVDADDISTIKKLTSHGFYSVINFISARKIQENSSDFRSMNKKSLTAFLTMKERRRFLRGMIHWVGFSTIVLPFKAASRAGGVSKYSWSKMLSLAVDGITSFSTAPLYISAIFGVSLFILAAIYALYVIFIRLFLNIT